MLVEDVFVQGIIAVTNEAIVLLVRRRPPRPLQLQPSQLPPAKQQLPHPSPPPPRAPRLLPAMEMIPNPHPPSVAIMDRAGITKYGAP
mmetsp:Transcript_7585/g.16845  ORF Transcript_7585/g.16845 Transcript_7585/m.16845 type:complete len:88 (+) Transcript_7585:1262-1525(+)